MKKIVCIALAACFVVALFSFSSSAADVSGSLDIEDFYWLAFDKNNIYHAWTKDSAGVYTLSLSGDISPQPYLKMFYLVVPDVPSVPEQDGRVVYLSTSFDLDVLLDNSLRWADSNNGDILLAAAFRSCRFVIQNTFLTPTAYVLRQPDGTVVDPDSADFWRQYVSNGYRLSIDILVDITEYAGSDIGRVDFYFPSPISVPYLWCSSYDDVYQLKINSLKLNYLIRPFNDVVQDDLSDIKGQLGTLNSTMNTIDQDVNRVNQSVTDLKDTIEDFQDDLTSSDSSISSDISDKQDIIDSIQDAMQNDNALLDDNLNDMITGFPGAQDPFHNAPSPDGFFAVDFIQQLWSFIKAQTIFFDFIFLGLCFCLATFILRR